jgi:hypothetical protein
VNRVSLAVALLLATAAGASAQQQPAPAPMPCQAPEYHQLDFWVGHWQASQHASGAADGESHITRAYGGCVIHEEWHDVSGMTGGSFSRYDRRTGKWRQTWVDSTGGQHDYVGSWTGARLEFLRPLPAPGDPTRTILHRMSLSPQPDGTVRQYYDDSSDSGKSWVEVYDLIYRRVKD